MKSCLPLATCIGPPSSPPGTWTDQIQDKTCCQSPAESRATDDEDSYIINVTYPCSRPSRLVNDSDAKRNDGEGHGVHC